MRIHWSPSLLIPFIAFRLLAQEAPVNPPAATAAEPPAAVAKPQPPPPPPVPPEEQDVDITSMMMFLKPDSVVMKVGSMDVKWSEVQPWIRFQQQKAQRNNQVLDSKELLKNLRAYLVQLASRGLFLQEAKALGLTVTEENKTRADPQAPQAEQRGVHAPFRRTRQPPQQALV